MDLGEVITSRSNARVKALRASVNGRASQPGELVGIEGEILIAEALRSIPMFDTVFVRQGSEDALERLSFARTHVKNWALLSRDVFDSVLETRSPQGIAAMFPIPEIASAGLHPGSGVSLVMAGLQDPGNMGTLLRSAEAFVIKQILLTTDTVNPWNPKSIRASAGSVFRLPVIRGDLQYVQRSLRDIGGPIYAAVARNAKATPLAAVSLLEPCALIIGNEGAGLSDDALAIADRTVWIPCATESLNAAVAGAVIMYESMRQNLLHHQTHQPQLHPSL